jgi:hypothetical protein
MSGTSFSSAPYVTLRGSGPMSTTLSSASISFGGGSKVGR